ncbi:hypothetical protein ABIA23_006704 [Sinorhizobium fredii]
MSVQGIWTKEPSITSLIWGMNELQSAFTIVRLCLRLRRRFGVAVGGSRKAANTTMRTFSVRRERGPDGVRVCDPHVDNLPPWPQNKRVREGQLAPIGDRTLRRDINPSTIQILLVEIEDDLRGMLLVERASSVAAIAIHIFVGTRGYFQFRRKSEEARAGDLLPPIVAAIQQVPERVLVDFTQEESESRASATVFIARSIHRALTNAFDAVCV